MAVTLHADVLKFAIREQVSVVTELDDIDTLARNYRPRLLRFVMASVRDEDLADTIVQDALLKAYRNRAGFRGDCSLNTWLTGIAVNLIRDHARTQKFKFWKKAGASSVDASEMANHLRSSGSSPEGTLLAREQALQVHQAMEGLSPNQRTVFLLRFIEEMDLAEIAEVMNMPVNTVKTHLHRAVKSVRARVGGQRV
ncbi:RNA polymerase sigma factor [Terriglobus sp. TAA 43]|uniref:RNA polymerase sigma factor n=1 Tax=Terriglobus sp. TAA 43 TaxID=278961 RepID=UPI0006477E5F|nr:sigma-70 family RNA polymerase sigma factor [Terriglobus sp. TAA 43]